MNIFSYEIDGKLYINLTNRCTNSCVFCVRSEPSYEGYELWLDKEPSFDDVVGSVDDLNKYSEVVFCGYGEPTYRMDMIKRLGAYFKKKGKKVRLNTNGHANVINGEDVTSLLVGSVDIVSVSLNANSKEEYQKLCRCDFGEGGFDEMLDFAKKCVQKGLEVVLSIVKEQGVDLEASENIAKSVGARLYARELI